MWWLISADMKLEDGDKEETFIIFSLEGIGRYYIQTTKVEARVTH